ncbi:D-alanyl-D-alanine carboxypeptidase/D-alanyl-D-alanine-endopeptidase [Pontibacter sp. 13R65]|uniref:D-alanyl-D-alanine carboxypeptidase/D-alanyl-D-alanine endopeptidase n=1 Tax=Pontibacter sp. 13R65 TaxID=3127458 RepID=UPI00301D7CBB
MKQLAFRTTFVFLLLLSLNAFPQGVPERLRAAFSTFSEDPQLRNGIASLYVLDANTGQVVFEQNGKTGLAPASTLKLITSATAYELLGKDFRYETKVAIRKKDGAALLLIIPSGDPTLGSWRWSGTNEEVVLNGIANALLKTGTTDYTEVAVVNNGWQEEFIPDGWIWQDVGNYYGAGPAKLNWRENQFDVLLRSGSQHGGAVSIVKTIPALHGYHLRSEVKAAGAGTGDKAYIYFPVNTTTATIRGTIPVGQANFKIAGAMPSPAQQLVGTLAQKLQARQIKIPATPKLLDNFNHQQAGYSTVHTITSPPLDSIVYWFNRKSINLYGEALLKTMAYQSTGSSATEPSLELVRNFWKKVGISETELNIADGSGLSPLNRVTTHAQARVLLHARRQPWFPGFYQSLPTFNGMKMKSGTIRDVKGFCGYHKSKDGKEYIFAFLVNNYNGSPATVTQKMYKVLDVLK